MVKKVDKLDINKINSISSKGNILGFAFEYPTEHVIRLLQD